MKGTPGPIALAGILILVCTLYFTHVLGATVTQIKVDTGNSALDQKINNFYKCVSDTGKDPPTLKVTDNCFTQNVNHGNMFISTLIPAFRFHFHHFSTQPRSDILSSFNHHHHHNHNHHGFVFGHTVIIHIPHAEVIHRN